MSNSKTVGENVVFKPTESQSLKGYYEVPGYPDYLVSPAGAV